MDLNKLIELAGQDTPESWELIDGQLDILAQNPEVYGWAYEQGLGSDEGSEQDLAATIFEKLEPESFGTLEEEYPEIRVRLQLVLAQSENPCARYRAAFALFKHGERGGLVIETIKQAEGDEAVAEIAQGYIKQLSSSEA